MLGKIIFNYGMTKIAPKVIATLITVAGVSGIGIIGRIANSEINYRYDKKAKDDTQDRTIKGYEKANAAKDCCQSA